MRAILEGRKTQTRRVMNGQPYTLRMEGWGFPTRAGGFVSRKTIVDDCPYGVAGDQLWVRETWATDRCYDHLKPRDIPRRAGVYYDPNLVYRWHKRRTAMFMPRWASRVTLEIIDVRVQRVQEISEKDAQAEGVTDEMVMKAVTDSPSPLPNSPWVGGFRWLWDSINATRGYGWEANPWVWCLTFALLRPCAKCSYAFDQDKLGKYGCPNCNGEGLG